MYRHSHYCLLHIDAYYYPPGSKVDAGEAHHYSMTIPTMENIAIFKEYHEGNRIHGVFIGEEGMYHLGENRCYGIHAFNASHGPKFLVNGMEAELQAAGLDWVLQEEVRLDVLALLDKVIIDRQKSGEWRGSDLNSISITTVWQFSHEYFPSTPFGPGEYETDLVMVGVLDHEKLGQAYTQLEEFLGDEEE